MQATEAWESLDAASKAATELAWQGFVDGNKGLGCVICNQDGRIVTEGRNRIDDSQAPVDHIHGSWIARFTRDQ